MRKQFTYSLKFEKVIGLFRLILFCAARKKMNFVFRFQMISRKSRPPTTPFYLSIQHNIIMKIEKSSTWIPFLVFSYDFSSFSISSSIYISQIWNQFSFLFIWITFFCFMFNWFENLFDSNFLIDRMDR